MHPLPIQFLAAAEHGVRPPGYDRRLAIIVPYRDRAAHLRQFIPHLLSYFQHDKLDRRIQHSVHIVEQAGSERFNRGKLKNVGFALTCTQADYFCFHDVDYLPVWADYSWPELPARLIWHGLTLKENHEEFFGGVVLFNRLQFEHVNGFSNGYWGWGYEDSEILLRMRTLGMSFAKRDGTYVALPHPHAGQRPDGGPTEETRINQEIFLQRMQSMDKLYRADGLSSLDYELLDSRNVEHDGRTLPHIYHHRVRI